MESSIVQVTPTASAKGVLVREASSGRPTYSFLGIPYAQPPVGELRFCAPQPLELWTGEREFSKHGPVCPQDMVFAAEAHAPMKVDKCEVSEDCLYLNIMTPSVDANARLPVMFWIHGGGFIIGMSDAYPGDAICGTNDVIMVSCNYRLGAFGFLCSGDDVIPGNFGLLDQIEALRWVKKHIAAFGGDPENITLFGESAGGMSVGFHVVSDLTKGLFKRAICQSGLAACSPAILTQQTAGIMLQPHLTKLGFQGGSSEDLLKFLRQKTADELFKGLPSDVLKPVVDGKFLVDTPGNLYKKGQFQKVPLMTGVNTHEGYLFLRMFGMLDPALPKQTPETFRQGMTPLLMEVFQKNLDQVLDKLQEIYMKPGVLDDRQSTLESYCKFFGDLYFDGPQRFTVLHHSKEATTYAYLFAKRPPTSTCEDWVVADHGQEVYYMLGAPLADPKTYPEYKSTEGDRTFSKMMMAYWTNFAKTGNPNGPGLDEWPISSSPKYEYLVLKDKPEISAEYDSERMDFWTECDGLV